ncbi:DUF3693 domain-containing protein [Vibrio variabilis]|uniref:DUF3693 domain-containing protein n=1 Tax=Vibrio variabilis TaxID=990271 RepID=UPI000DD9F654|nr:DUF3693 domain-containing protein [Vibrio variabilis]
MQINELLDAYKSANKYSQDKQIAHDLQISTQKLSDIRKGRRYLTEKEALLLADKVGADKEIVLIQLAADKCKTVEGQQAWANIAKKFESLGISRISMALASVGLVGFGSGEPLSQCVLSILC